MNNTEIKDACEFVRLYHLVVAGLTFLETDDKSVKEQTLKVVEHTDSKSDIATLIKENKWEELFKKEMWLSLLQGAQSFSALNRVLIKPLKTISENFPKETEYYIIPVLLRE